ncbi:MAG: polymerase, sigma-24 subunit, subfamily [Flavisolibacter sp.]|jgi:RNA polymerase sigma-70 factor (family 1)|nr:polymerase, sigma-24 subunit, subfamily [Flavisolibacter sp.]
MKTVENFDEAALIKRLKEDDRDAFVQLYNHYHHPLYIFILRFVKIPGTAEDILQDVFLKIWEIRSRVNPELSLNAYLYRISRNAVFKLLKKTATDDDMRSELMQQLDSDTEAPHIKLQWKQYNNILQQAINHLPPQRQKVFKLCREEGKTYDQAATELGISKNTIKEHMVSAMKSIKEYVHLHGDISLCLLFLVLEKNIS